jgi:Tc toxin complex TcA C-terminal TcB-binding domain/ABC toxin N-terminal region/Neuraminidase-like domain/Salmonella virulence plasmid 28.1kDa A protein/Putative peptidoglycan binding domain
MKPVTFTLKLQMKRAEVGDLHQALSFLGLAIAGAEKSNQRFGASTRAAVRQFQMDRKLPETGEVDEATAAAINKELADRGVLDVEPGPNPPTNPPDAEHPTVQGTVTHKDGTAVNGVRVRAFHRRLAGELLLGETASQDRGQYAIVYEYPEGTSRVDLFERVYDDKEVILAVSPIRIGATGKQVLNVIVEAERFRGPSEFERAGGALSSQVAGANFDEIDANDVALLVRTSLISRQSVTAWIASRRLAERTGIAQEALYGLVRRENTAALPRLLGRSSARLTRDLVEAARTNIISLQAGNRARETVVALKKLAANLSDSAETPGSLGRIISTSSKASAEQRRVFLQRYGTHDGKISEFWQALRKDQTFGEDVVNDLQFSIQLGTLTANHAPLVAALRARGLTRSSETAALTRDGWREILTSKIDGAVVGAPPSIKGATEAERLENYLTLLMERTALAFPTAKVTHGLKAIPEWRSSTAVAFLDANPDFNLLARSLSRIFESKDYVIEADWDQQTLMAELSTVQRVMRVSFRGQDETVVNGLLTKGYSSAFSIVRKSRDSFIRHAAQDLGGESRAKEVYRNARFQVSRAVGAFGLMHPRLADPMARAVGGISERVSNDATWSSLFGNVDYCKCEHCRSIYSPAAYLVDLLAWLDTHELNGSTAFDRLDARRPDIKRIELSCENTNTVLPYVDLVLEILEDRVLSMPVVDGTEVPVASTATSAELLANPEYLHPEAYDEHLAKAVYPWLLPFDLWSELGRIYFEHLRVRRSDLMEALARQDTPRREAISADRLDLSLAHWRILTGAARRPAWAFWGYQSATPRGTDFKEDLAVGSNLLRRAGFEYDDLLDLLHSRCANPNKIKIVGDACNTDELTLEVLADGDLEKMHRFLRLWRNRGWSMLDLDKALYALNPADIDAAALHALADLDRIQALTKEPLLDILCWWSVIDTFEDRPEKSQPVKSLYQQIFLNRAVDPAAEEPTFPLALNAARTGLLNTVSWDDVRTQLQAALRIDDGELSLLVDETVDGIPNGQRVVTGPNATLEDLSALYRHVSFARALKLKVSDFLGVLTLTGIDPFDVGQTGATVDLIETVSEIRSSGFSLDELHYLLEHDADAETRVGVTDEAISLTLVEIRDGLAAIENEFAVTADPNGEVTARYLGVILEADAAAAVMATLQTEANASNHSDLAQVLVDHLGALFTFDADHLITLPVEQRFDAMVSHLAPYLKDVQSDALVVEKIGTFAGRGLDSAEDLLSLRVGMTVDGKQLPSLMGLQRSPYVSTETTEIVIDDDPEAFATLRRIFKISLVLNKLAIDMDEQLWLFDVGVSKDLLNPVSLPSEPQPIATGAWTGWTRLVDLFWLRKGLPGGEPRLVELLRLLDSDEDTAAAEATFKSELSARTGWLVDDIETLVTAFGLRFPWDWFDGQALKRLVEAFALIRRTGVSAMQADLWVTGDIDMAQAEALRFAAKSKHDEAQWPAIARALRDPVREKQRAALVSYLIAQLPKYTDESDLYSDLLIDVEMDPCMLTSRIKQAISSVQLFVQRAFLNLEDGVALTRADRDQWEWMKNYRVWEANRKVFLYPENWIEPDLRINKSELFEQLENSLMQGEVTDASVEKAYTEYLEGLLKVARLEVMGIYHQFEEDEDGTVDILHVVARTKGHPLEYFYRQWIDEREWTPWEKLDADIEADHIILAVYDRRLYVFWPLIVQKAEGDQESTTNFFEMKLAWIERLHGQWGARKLSVEFLRVEGNWDRNTDTSEPGFSMGEMSIYFRLGNRETLAIECRQGVNAFLPGVELLGTFVLDCCSGSMLVEQTVQATGLVAPANNFVNRMRFRPLRDFSGVPSPTAFGLMSGTADESGRLIGLADEVPVGTMVSGTIAYPHQYGEFASQHGVFLDDDERTFHVMPEQFLELDRYFDEESKDELEPGNVGITYTQYDVFEQDQDWPKFDPELPWDSGPRDQELPLPARQTTSLTKTEINFDDAALILSGLSDYQLQNSQNQLYEVSVFSDSYTIPRTTKYRFSLFYHPYVCDFLMELRRLGVAGLLDPNPDGPAANLVRQQRHRLEFFEKTYEPTTNVLEPYPIQDIDFEFGGSYAEYNWEIFFHAPFLIASRLSQNQRFEEARKWYHFIFDPTNRSDDEDPLRFWKIKPFYREADAPISEFLELASSAATGPEAEATREQYDEQVDAWLDNPFDPHAIARLRTTAYQKAIVMKYLDNLIAWGDSLFRRDTIESINVATQLYILALDLLGERPDALSPRAVPVAKTFEQVRQDLADSVLNNPLVQLENVVFKSSFPSRSLSRTSSQPIDLDNALFDVSLQEPSLYFCIPPNDKLLGYWDTVEDRLFKIRHCMNIEGIVRQLPLFEPPIDPGMLVRARAAGVDLASALADLNAPLPHYRFSAMLQKAYALNQSVRGLAGALLSALEKKDAEELAGLRANQEVALLEAIRQVKKLAIDEGRQTLGAAEHSLEVVRQRNNYYQSLINGGWLPGEKVQKDLLEKARRQELRGNFAMGLGSTLSIIPEIKTGVSGIAGSPVLHTTVVSGISLAKASELAGRAFSADATAKSAEASVSGITAGYVRRLDEWRNQLQSAQKEIKQVEKQIEAARVRVALAERDLENQERQIEQARTVQEFMEGKFTSTELYQWMVGQISSLYFQSYQLAYDLAKQTERAYRHELALPDVTFINFGYWDSLKKGLLASERLQLDLERMDKSYLENNRREYEITKHVSLSLLDPVALLKLQTEGECEFSVPEALFDTEYPGHYLRRIKSVAVSMPCVTGPYTSVPARLTLVASRTRIDSGADDAYPIESSGDASDPRFQFHTGAVESIIVSAGREDAGLFVLDHRDDRYLPFEGTGAISDWNLKLTSAVPTFDWSTITDVVLHLRYSAREGGDLLRDAALISLTTELAGIPLQRGFSAKHEFPTEWSAFLRGQSATEASLKLDLSEKRFPYFARNLGLTISEIQLVALVKDIDVSPTIAVVNVTPSGNDPITELNAENGDYGGHPSGSLTYDAIDPGEWEITVDTSNLGAPTDWIDDFIVIATYKFIVPT